MNQQTQAVERENGAIVRMPEKQLTWDFTPEQRRMISNMFLNGATELEAQVLMEIARARRLNPLLRQIHFVKRWDSERWDAVNRKRGCYVWSAQVAIDGLRALAERSGTYDGQDEPDYIYDEEGKLELVKVRIYRKGISRPFVGIAHWREFVQYAKKGEEWVVNSFWKRMPHVMLSKCAEALGIRKGFPDDTSGLYIPEEMGSEESVLLQQGPAEETTPAPATGSNQQTGPAKLPEGKSKLERDLEASLAARAKGAKVNKERPEKEKPALRQVAREAPEGHDEPPPHTEADEPPLGK